MKRFLMTIVLFLLVSPLLGSDVKFTITYPTTPLPSGFELRISGTTNGVPTRTVDCGQKLDCIVSFTTSGTGFVKAYAYNESIPVEVGRQYSDPSPEATFTIAPKPLTPGLKVSAPGSAQVIFNVEEDQIANIQVSFEDKPSAP